MFLWNIAVTSLAEVWIEILESFHVFKICRVTSLAEVWIEILLFLNKFCQSSVTSLAEVWIEISFLVVAVADAVRHFPCGSVD